MRLKHAEVYGAPVKVYATEHQENYHLCWGREGQECPARFPRTPAHSRLCQKVWLKRTVDLAKQNRMYINSDGKLPAPRAVPFLGDRVYLPVL